MKRNLLLFCIAAITSFTGIAQAPPPGINYQAIARDPAGKELTGKTISVRFSIHSNTATGTIAYQETHVPVTNAYGLFTVVIGSGTVSSGNFNTIPWGSGNHFLEVELDPNGGSSYTSIGTTQFMSVPYALYARNAQNGPAGLNCWDLNGDGVKDPAEDLNSDGFWDANDCKGPKGDSGSVGPVGPQGSQGAQGIQGPQGTQGVQGTAGTNGLNCWDINGNGIKDPAEDLNSDGIWDVKDCKGAKGDIGATGPQGPQGLQGTPGLNCWDLNGNGIKDPNEDINSDGFWNTLDCKPAGSSGIQLTGTTGQTIRHDATNWLASSLLYNNGNNIGIGTTTPDPNAKLQVNGSVKIVDGTEGNGKVLTSDPTGMASWQTPSPGPKIAFRAQSNAFTTISGSTAKMNFATENFDDGLVYDPSASTFTVPSPGLYYIESSSAFNSIASGGMIKLSIDNNGSVLASSAMAESSAQPESCHVSGIFKLNAGDKITIIVNLIGTSTASRPSNIEYNWFSAFKIY